MMIVRSWVTSAFTLAAFYGDQFIDIIDIDPRTDNPTPRAKQFNIGYFGHRFVFTRLGPEIINESLALVLAHLRHLDEKFFTIGIFESGEVFANQCRFDGMHYHTIVATPVKDKMGGGT